MLLGLGAFALAVVLQLVVAVLSFSTYTSEQRLAYCLLPFVLTALLVVPVRPSRWPVTRQRARNVGVLWLVIGIVWPAWLYLGQFPLAAGVLAGPAALVGSVIAHRRAR